VRYRSAGGEGPPSGLGSPRKCARVPSPLYGGAINCARAGERKHVTCHEFLKIKISLSCYFFSASSINRLTLAAGSTTPTPIHDDDNMGCALPSGLRNSTGLPSIATVPNSFRPWLTIPRNLNGPPMTRFPNWSTPVGILNTGPPLLPGNTLQSIMILEFSGSSGETHAIMPCRSRDLDQNAGPIAPGKPERGTA